jgi:hypothetical protein
VIVKNFSLEILTDLHFLSPLDYEYVVFNAISMYGCAPPTPERLDGVYSSSVFKSLSFVGRCLLNMNILTPKVTTLYRIPQTQIIFSKTAKRVIIKF